MCDPQAFLSTRRNNTIHSDSFVLNHAKLGVQNKKTGIATAALL